MKLLYSRYVESCLKPAQRTITVVAIDNSNQWDINIVERAGRMSIL